MLVQSKRNKHAALKLMRKLLKKYAFVPDRGVREHQERHLVTRRVYKQRRSAALAGWRALAA